MATRYARTKSPVGTTINARFDGWCRGCRTAYKAGDPIRKMGEKIWVCLACANGNGQQNGHTQEQAPPPPPPPPPQSATVPQLDAAALEAAVTRIIEGAELQVDEAEVRTLCQDELTKAGIIKHVVEVKLPTGIVHEMDGRLHPLFSKCVTLAACRRNILMVGPAGCGKTHLASQVAESLGLRFKHISCSAGMSEGQLMGRLLPIGEGGRFEYVISDFVDCYENGGVFLFDEIDAADPNTLLVINSALANGCMAVPNRPGKTTAEKHPDFVCIAAANTFGTGADRQYVGRSQLDESTLDRFRIGQLALNYDDGFETEAKAEWTAPTIPSDFANKARTASGIEADLCPDVELRTRLQWYRHRITSAKLRRIVSTRFLRDAYQVKQAGFTDGDIDAALFSGWTPDEVAKVRG